jgi:hypothetical protein
MMQRNIKKSLTPRGCANPVVGGLVLQPEVPTYFFNF